MEAEITKLKDAIKRLENERDRLQSIIEALKRKNAALVSETNKKLEAAKCCVEHSEEQIAAANAKTKFWESQGRMANDLAERTRRDFQIMQKKHDELLKEKYFRNIPEIEKSEK